MAELRNSVKIIQSITEINSVRKFWESNNRHRDTDIDYYLLTLKEPQVLRPYILAYYRDDIPVALLVGRCEAKNQRLKFGYLPIPTPTMRILSFGCGAFVGEVSEFASSIFVKNILQSLRDGQADAAEIVQLKTGSPLFEAANLISKPFLRGASNRPGVHRIRRMHDGAGPFLTSISKNEREQQRRRERRLNKEFGKVRIEHFTAELDLDRLMADSEKIAKNTYQRGIGVGFFDNQEIRHRLQLGARQGWLHGHILYLADQPCSFSITALYRGVLYCDYLGYDVRYAKCAPGMYLIMKIIEEFHDGFHDTHLEQIDFGYGDAEYKARLGNEVWQESAVSFFAPNPMAIGVNALQTVVAISNRSAGYFLEKTGLSQKIKRLWRRKLTNA
jgi:hypothetical protein